MNASTRRTALAAATTLAFVGAVLFGGGYAVGLLSDQERADASIRAASDFGGPPADDALSFAGCGQVRLELPEDASFSLTVTLYDSSADDQHTVTVTEADAGSPSSGFWYHSGQNRYRFVAQKAGIPGGGRILTAELDGKRYENDHGCADVGTEGTTSVENDEITTAGNDEVTTAGNDGTTTTAENDETTTTAGNDGTTTIGASTAGDATTATETETTEDTARTSTTTEATTAKTTSAEATAADVTTTEPTTTETTTAQATAAGPTTTEATTTEPTTAEPTTTDATAAEPTTPPETKTTDDESA